MKKKEKLAVIEYKGKKYLKKDGKHFEITATHELSQSEEKKCLHCGGYLSKRNPMGYCDHLYYPHNCMVCIEREAKSPPPPSLQDTKEKPDKGDFTQGRWLKSLHLNPKQEHYIIATVKGILKSHRHQYAEELKGEIEGMKIEWVEGKLTDKEKIRLKNMVNGALDRVLSLLERKGEK